MGFESGTLPVQLASMKLSELESDDSLAKKTTVITCFHTCLLP